MAYGPGAIAVAANGPVRLYRNTQRDHQSNVTITNTAGTPLLLGGSNVSATVYGYSLAAGASLTISIAPQDDLWAFSAGGGTALVLSSP